MSMKNHSPSMRLKSLLPILLLTCCTPSVAQREHTTLFGAGRANQYDTYLSPLEYRGPQVTIQHSTLRPLQRNTRISFQTITQIEYSYTKNPTGVTHEHGGAVRFDAGWNYNWANILFPDLQLMAGGLLGMDGGFLYNERNGNNPAQGRLSAKLSATAGAAYHLHIRRKTLTLQYQAIFPLFGGMFSPQYGQSYYNIFTQGNYDHNVIATHPGNALSLRQRLVVSIPLRSRSLTVGYLSDLLQSKPHHLRQHQYSRGVVIGWTIGNRKDRD